MNESSCTDCGVTVTRVASRGAIPKRCGPCETTIRRARVAKWKLENREALLASDRERSKRARQENPERFRSYKRNEDPEKRKVWRRRYALKRFGMSTDDYDSLMTAQDGRCAICRRVDVVRLAVDHDHLCCPGRDESCGKCVRGLLCRTCNTAIGLFRDDPGLLVAAHRYLTGGTEFE